MKNRITRRDFLQKSSLIIALSFTDPFNIYNCSVEAAELPFKPHAFLEISKDESIIIWVGQTNLGQGTHTGIPMIIADELDADWKNVSVKMALASEAFKDPIWHFQATGGSTSIRHRWDLLRKTGASAKQVLLYAASKKWKIPAGKLKAKDGYVFNPKGEKISYGNLVDTARKLKVPGNPTLKKPEEYRIIGTKRMRFDIPDKVQGKTVFGIDFKIPEMLTAVVARPEFYGSTVVSYDEKAAMAIKGVIKVVKLENRIAVCAQNTYPAIKGREALKIKWSNGVDPSLSDKTIDETFDKHLKMKGVVALKKGDVDKALSGSSKVIENSYKLPYLSHAQVEPINCTAHVENNRCRLWIPTQGQSMAQLVAAKITGLKPDKVEVMTTPAGGGFGLRGETDSVVDSVLLSKMLKKPVKVMWTREDDFKNDYYRPSSKCIIKAGLDNNGKITAWSHRVAAPSVMDRIMPQYVKNGVDGDAISGIGDMVYNIPNKLINYSMVKLPVPVGWWRSVGYSVNTFTVESFIDELSYAAKKDPLMFRLEHMEKDSRPYKLLSLLADKGGWNNSLPQNHGKGVALTRCFESYAAHMAEVSVDRGGIVKVHRVVCAIDCGTAVNPDQIKAQAEAGVVMGLSTAFHEKMSFENGGVKTSNYVDYKVLTMGEVPPVIEVYIMENNYKAGGIGEPVLPSLAPAVSNAVFNIRGVRLRELPFDSKLLSA